MAMRAGDLARNPTHFYPHQSLGELIQCLTVVVETTFGKQFYLFGHASKQQVLLGENARMQFAAALAPVKPIAFQSRGGLTLHGYLTLPNGVAPKNLPTAATPRWYVSLSPLTPSPAA